MQMNLYLKSLESTEAFAKEMAGALKPPLIVGLRGEIGMGKTSLVRALLRSLGIQSAIKSPTFNLVETYETDLGVIHHFDLYRISSLDDLEYLGFRDYLQGPQICLVEWPEKVESLLDVMVEFYMPQDREGRTLSIKANTILGEQMIAKLLEKT